MPFMPEAHKSKLPEVPKGSGIPLEGGISGTSMPFLPETPDIPLPEVPDIPLPEAPDIPLPEAPDIPLPEAPEGSDWQHNIAWFQLQPVP